MRLLWEWRWLVAWFMAFAVVAIGTGPDSPVGPIYAGLTGLGLLYLWARWGRGLGTLTWELQDALGAYFQLGEQLAELVAAPSGGQERLQRLDALAAKRHAAEEKLDGLLGRWPRNAGLAGRIFPSWGQSVERNLAVALQSRQRAARTYDLMATAIAQSEV
ncbi:MAG: hypothetical protein IVW53_01670 [Chloroflexi bacterium]|nr:hypothetical protein [Chloroflexota bacterium]